jgi:hypothetical protein
MIFNYIKLSLCVFVAFHCVFLRHFTVCFCDKNLNNLSFGFTIKSLLKFRIYWNPLLIYLLDSLWGRWIGSPYWAHAADGRPSGSSLQAFEQVDWINPKL